MCAIYPQKGNVFQCGTQVTLLHSSGPFTLTQKSTIPVVFTGLQDGAQDFVSVDDADKQQLLSTNNPDVPNFSLHSDSEGEEDIPCSQP